MIDSQLKISIITPSYNQAQYIEQTIDSVLSQNLPNLEYIIIDGGSTDGSIDIINKYEKYLTLWVSEPDNGQSHAINKGIAKATGDVINWLNSDDYLQPNSLRFIAEQFENPEIKVLCAKANLVNADGKIIKVSDGTDVYESNLAKTIGWARFDQPETYFKREVWQKVGFLNLDMHYLMDREWWVRYLFIFGLSGIVQTDNVIVNFRLHESSKTVTSSKKFQWDHDAIYYFMALNYGFIDIAKLIEANCQINISYAFPDSLPIKKMMAHEVLNYYLLHRAHEFYYYNKKRQTKEFLNHIIPQKLDSDSKKLYKKLYYRNTYLPKFIIKALRD